METPTTAALVKKSDVPSAVAIVSPFQSPEAFIFGQRMAQALATSDLVPDTYKSNVGNCLLALELSQRIGCSVLMVMQHMNPIKGRPGWSAAFLIAAINACGRFSPLRFERKDLGQKEVEYHFWEGPHGNRVKRTAKLKVSDESCVAFCRDKANGEILRSPAITVEMAVKEGWYTRDGSKWQTMREAMLSYRAAAFFSRLYCPEITMGIRTQDEVEDILGTDASHTTIDVSEPVIPPRTQKALTVSAAGTEADLAAMRQQGDDSTPGPAVGIARRGPGRPRKNPAPETPASAAEPAQEHASIAALRLMMQQNGLTESEVCQAGFEFSFTKPEQEPRGSIAEWEPDEADLAVKNSVAIIEAIAKARKPQAPAAS